MFICHLGSLPATDLSGVFVVLDVPLKLLNSSLRSLANGVLQPGGVIAKQDLVKCFAGVVVHLIGHFMSPLMRET